MGRITCWTCLALTTLAACGCGSGEKTCSVDGTVTLDGQPLAEGRIYFVTTKTGDLEILPIAGGKFEGAVKPGSRRVEIRAYRQGEPRSPMPGMPPEAPIENYLPGRYNAQSTLNAEVKESGPNQFTFALTSEPDPPPPDENAPGALP
jgi:hypothetical protein